MPYRPPRICRDCRKVATKNGYCDAHQGDNRAKRAEAQRREKRRDSGFKALYDSPQWRKVTRPNVLRRYPLCVGGWLCDHRAPSTEIDHVIRVEVWIEQHGGDESHFWDEENLEGLCKPDHGFKTSRENAGTWKPQIKNPASTVAVQTSLLRKMV